MTRLADTFADTRPLIAYLMAGDPDLRRTAQYVRALEDGGADIIELGVPFSDPIADGPVIQRAGERALRSGTTIARILDMVSEIRTRVRAPLVLMGYYNPVFRYGVDRFVRDAAGAGVDGAIIPDLIPEEAGEFSAAARRAGLPTIFLLAPTSTDERIRRVSRLGCGFLYYVSVTGVTGARSVLPADIKRRVRRIQELSSLPVAVGFGVSSSRQVRDILSFADAVIVGSAIVSVMEKGKGPVPARLTGFIRSLKKNT